MPEGRKEIIETKVKVIGEIIEHRGREIDKLKTALKDAKDASEINRIKAEIAECHLNLKMLHTNELLLGELGELSGDNEAITSRIGELRQENVDMKDALKSAIQDLRDQTNVIKDALADTFVKVDQSKEILEEYIKSYEKDNAGNQWIGGLGLLFGVAGLIAGAVGIGIAKLLADSSSSSSSTPAPSPTPASNSAPSLLRTGSNTGTRAGDQSDPAKISSEDGEKIMLDLVVSKTAIADGKVPQELLWKALAATADTADPEGQDWTLIFVQEAALHMPGREEFFWLDPSEAQQRYESLRAAYKTSKKLSDVYLAALQPALLKHDGKEVPIFHVALLIQWALKLIKHDRLFPSADAVARG
jgi:hypothetical protein